MSSLTAMSVAFLIYLPFFAVAIVCLVLSIKLMRRGIKALDKYIAENSQ